MNHRELVDLGARWCRNAGRCPLVWAEAKGCHEEPDVFGVRNTGATTITVVIEAKASRADFLADRRKSFRRYPGLGMGRKRYYLAPKGMIAREELPQGWGLLEATPGRCRRVIDAPKLLVWSMHADLALMARLLVRQEYRMAELRQEIETRAALEAGRGGGGSHG